MVFNVRIMYELLCRNTSAIHFPLVRDTIQYIVLSLASKLTLIDFL